MTERADGFTFLSSVMSAVNRAPRRGARWLLHRFYRYQPGAILAVVAVLVGVPLALDLGAIPFLPVREWLDRFARSHEVGVNLLEHVLVAALVAAAAWYWVLGLKQRQALRRYRQAARNNPGQLVDWSQEAPPDVRRGRFESVAKRIARTGSREPAVALVHGRAGTARTSFVVGLVQDLAKNNLIPIPVHARRDGWLSLDWDDLAQGVFCKHVRGVLSSDQQADEIWRRATNTRDIVILVDGLDDEVVAMLWSDGGGRFRKKVETLRDAHFAVVLATTRELPLGNLVSLREDLDAFSRLEANDYVRRKLEGVEADGDAIAALERLPDPVDDTLVAPFYLELIVRLRIAGIPLDDLPEHTDRWRATVIGRYLDGIEGGLVIPRASSGKADGQETHSRGSSAKEVAEALARELTGTPKRDDLTVPRNSLSFDDRVLDDARDLNLLWHDAQRVGFAGDDLGAYLAARTHDDPSPLLEDVHLVAERQRLGIRRIDRHVLFALIYWHVLHEGRERIETFDGFLKDLETERWTRPVVAATAVRIASTCELAEFNDRVAEAVGRCIESLDRSTEQNASPRRMGELLRLVRSLAEWQAPEAHWLLWQLATNQNIEVEWPAAKALATAKDGPERTLETEIDRVLREADEQTPASLSDPDPRNDLGYEVASLAWILPALGDADGRAREQLSRVTQLCRDDHMSPLRGEMSLAQGLKLAVMNGRADRSVDQVRELLFGGDQGLRYWHARLVLVQAMLAHAWDHRESAGQLRKELRGLRKSEHHPFVKRGIDLARDGLLKLERSPDGNAPPLGRYMWTHERDVVRWVEQGRENVMQLAADVVLLSNMTYRRRKQEAGDADRAAMRAELPHCLRRSSDRKNITKGCSCPHGLCRDPEPPAVLATRARFSESFCREQALLVARLGPPSWTKPRLVPYRHAQPLKDFWDGQATKIAQFTDLSPLG